MKTRMPKFGAVPIAIFQEDGLTMADIRVYTVLAMFQGNNEDSYPSRQTIADNANISVESVSRAIGHLVELGWAERDQRGFGQSNIYRVMVETDDARNATGAISGNATGDAQEMLPVPLPSIKQKDHSKKKSSSSFGVDSDPYRLAMLLLTEHRKLDRIFANGKEEETVQRWAMDIDKLIRLDHRTVEDIRAVITFSQESDFWCANIISGSKLRDKFDTLLVQSKKTAKTTPLFPSQSKPNHTFRSDEQKAMDKAILEKLYADRE